MMKAIAKRVLFGLLALTLTLSLVACGSDPVDTNTTTTAGGDDVVTTTVAGEPGDATTTTDAGQQGDASSSKTTTTTGTKKPSGTQGSLSWAQVKANMPANLRGSTIKVYNWNEASSITDAEKVIANFTKETGITVKWEVGSYDGYITEIAAKQAAKDAPDVIRMKEVNPAAMTLLQPLSDTGYNFDDAAWDQTLMDVYTYKGKAYATNLADTLQQQPDVFLYNKTLIKKYDLDDPYTLWKQGKWTWNKFVEISTAFKKEAGDSYEAFSAFDWMTGSAMLGLDFVKYTQNGYVSTMTDKKLEQGIKMMIQLKKNDLVAEKLYQRTTFEAGKVLFHHDSIIGARKTHFYYRTMKSEGTLGIVPLPTVDGEKTYWQVFSELEAYGVPTGAKNAAAVPYYLRYFLDSENYNTNSFFANKEVQSVYEHCMNQKNRYCAKNYKTVLTEETGTRFLAVNCVESNEGQVATVLSKERAVVEAAVKQANMILSKLG